MPYKDPEKRKAKQREYNQRWYAKAREKHIRHVVGKRRELRDWLAGLKATLRCARCAIDHPAVLVFHHAGGEKEVSIGSAVSKGWSKKRILSEINKCEVLCANCHRILHWEEREG